MDQYRTYVDRKFGHCRVKWELKNFCTLWYNEKERFTITSPEFYIRSSPPTKWRMQLKISIEDETQIDICPISLALKRLVCDNNYQLATADCKLAVSDEQTRPHLIYFRKSFLPNSEYVTKEINFLQRSLLHSSRLDNNVSLEPTIFEIRLEVLVHFQHIQGTFSPCRDLGIKKLSEDLDNLYETAQASDISLVINEQPINVHVPIICSRINNKEMKEDISECEFLEYYLYYPKDYSAWESVIRFLYSANMHYVVMVPSISIYEVALNLQIEPIIAYYEPDRLKLYSTNNVDECSLTWTINNFICRAEPILMSPFIMDDVTNTKCRLKIYPRGFGSRSEWTGLFIDIDGGEKDICVEFFVQSSDKWVPLCRIHKRITGREIFGNKKAVERRILKNYVQNNNLTLGFILRMANGIRSNVIGESTVVYKPFSEQLNYVRLSEDILSLYEKVLYNDMDVPENILHNSAPVHMCILSARCENGLYQTLVNGLQNNTELLRSNAFQYLLCFLYSGRLTSRISPTSASILYSIAEQFDISTLKHAVIINLKKYLTAQTARLVYEFAELRNIYVLRDYAWRQLMSNRFNERGS